MHLVYSRDDGGWYWERYGDWATSQVFATELDAKLAAVDNTIAWETN